MFQLPIATKPRVTESSGFHYRDRRWADGTHLQFSAWNEFEMFDGKYLLFFNSIWQERQP